MSTTTIYSIAKAKFTPDSLFLSRIEVCPQSL